MENFRIDDIVHYPNRMFLKYRFAQRLAWSLVGVFLSSQLFAADLYWVGGSGSWHNRTSWSSQSGGKGGTGVPTSKDNVHFDQNSFDSYSDKVTVQGRAECRSIDWSSLSYKVIFASDVNSSLYIYGDAHFSDKIINNFYGSIHLHSNNWKKMDMEANGMAFQGPVLFDTPSAASPGPLSPDSVCPFTIVTSSTAVSCNGFSDGIARVDSLIGETGPITYVWLFNGSTADSLTGLGPGTYTVRVTDVGTGCVHFKSQAVTEPAELVIFATPPPQDASCFSVCDGDGSVTAIDGTPPYSYTWSNGCTQSNCTGLCVGNYTITVTDINGCQDNISITIDEPGLLVANEGSSNVQCNAACDGTAYVAPSGGTTPYTYVWTNASTQDTLKNLCPGAYSVTITDKNGCQAFATLNITEPNPMVTTPAEYHISCGGLCDGEVAVDVTGGTTPYSYLWAPGGETTDSLSNLCSGPYSVTVTDANGCTSVENYTINEPVVLTSSITDTTHVLCNGSCTGVAIVTPAGGTTPFTYLWSNAQTDSTATGLCNGAFGVTITDANGCTTNSSVTITQPNALSQTLTLTNATCNGVCDGTILSSPAGGTTPYSYLWNNGQTNATATGLCAGAYSVTVTDANGCTINGGSGIAQPTAFTGSITGSSNVTCGGSCNGSATIAVSGGTASYTYLWNDGQTTPTATGLCAGNYTVTSTDANGCTVNDAIVITEPLTLVSSITGSTNLDCYAVCTGSATVTASDGTAPYTYLWNSGQTTTTATGLCSGAASVTVTDALGCTSTSSTNLTEPATYSLAMSKTDPGCGGACDATATVTPSGGTPGYTYLWSNGCTQITCITLCAGQYTVTVTDVKACTLVDSVTIPVTPIPAIDSSTVSVTCNGVCDGSGTFTASSGTPPYSYTWNTGCTTGTCTGLCAGAYTVTVSDNTGCTTSATLTVPGFDIITANEAITDAQCNAICDGAVTLAPTGGLAPYTYLWSDGCTSISCSGFCPGNVSVTVTDQNGCTTTPTFTINVTNPVVVNTSSNPVQCFGQCDGDITATPSGGSAPYTYAWTTGCTTQTCTGICVGNYTVTVTGSGGCFNTQTISVSEPTVLSTSFTSSNNATCFGQCDGAGTAAGAGGTTPYSYTWDNGATVAVLTGLCAGNYNLTVTDAHGCEVTDLLAITEPADLLANESANSSTCGNADGDLISVPTGGTSPYTYVWDNGCTQATCNGVGAGSYNLTVTDASGCSVTANVLLSDLGGPTGETFINTPASCNGVCDGTSMVTPIGGVAPFTYVWTGGQTNATATGLCAGSYNVTVTDNNGCKKIGVSTVTEPIAISANLTDTTMISCNSLCDGTVIVTPSGGSVPYTYAWSDGQTDSTATGLCVGLYNVTVTDLNGCNTTATITMTEPTVLTADITDTTHVSCAGQCTGQTIVTPGGGTPPFTYLWDDGQTDSTATALCAGNYSVTVTDAGTCQTIAAVTISEPVLLTALATITGDASCNGVCDGTATGDGIGGTSPYTYLWSNGQTTKNASGFCAGNITVTVTDANGCTATNTAVVSEPVILGSSITNSVNNVCFGDCAGIASVTPTGGTIPYSYLWSNGQTDSTSTGLCSGTSLVTITDANSCTKLDSVIITEPTELVADSGVVNSACGSCNGIGIAVPGGGTGPYTYLWSSGCTSGTCFSLCAGAYDLTVTDANGCTATNTVLVSNTGGPTNGNAVLTAASCNGVCDGMAVLSPTGGTGPYTYMWNDASGQTTATATGLCAGNYIVSITDSKGCLLPVSVTINQPGTLASSFTDSLYVDCNGNCTGLAVLTPSGGTSPYAFVWDDGQTDSTATGLCAGVIGVTVTDANGCQTTNSITITEPASLIPSIASSVNLSCNGVCVGTAEAAGAGGTLPYSYVWSDGQTDSVATGLCAGNYDVTLTDANGCAAQTSVTITEPNSLAGNSSTVASTCGVCDGSVSVAPS
ncbi:MAG: SprB repeat-containing protein, partial [Flavobacteriales bacterium]|nr:SprB repeat-containing protein [Flavobacteriales bacterium]